MRVLLVEDEPAVARMIRRGLGPHGYQVTTAESGEDAAALLAAEPFDLVLLDIMLPGQDGHETLAAIRRQRPDMPVVMLTARDDLASKVSALDGGADDYITKPFAYEELLARLRAVSRRTDQPASAGIEVGDVRIDLRAHRVWRNGEPVALSRREFALLEYFARHPGQILSRQQILDAVWEYDFDGESNIVDVYVRYLRNKLDRPGEASLVTTVRGVGYRFDPLSAP
ncbi:MAG: response regulator transcription factor [Thermomicrobiales bacterium]|nr:response regulator transcription factor [Thermomicrobiales bacterium]